MKETGKLFCLLCLSMLAVFLSAGTGFAFKPEADTESTGRERYRILEERNFFLRDRSPRQPETRREPPPPPPPEPARYIVLSGIARADGQYIAFLEDTRNRQVMLRRIGEEVADGVVAAITLDRLEYDDGSEIAYVEVGSNLQGRSSASAAAGDAAGVNDQRESGEPRSQAVESEDRRAILERLRQRRQEELQ